MRRNSTAWFVVVPLATLVIGLLLGGIWPQTPLHATATDRIDTFIVCTGAVDEEIEAVYCLDCLTGDLVAAVVGRVPGRFGAQYRYNVLKDFGVEPSQNPKFTMVTGIANFSAGGGGRVQPSLARLYIAEATTGKLIAYALPFDRSAYISGHAMSAPPQPVGLLQIRQPTAGR